MNKTILKNKDMRAYLLRSSKFCMSLIPALFLEGIKNSKLSVFAKVGSSYINKEGNFFDESKLMKYGTPAYAVISSSHKKFFEKKGVANSKIFDEQFARIDQDFITVLKNNYEKKIEALQKSNKELKERVSQSLKTMQGLVSTKEALEKNNASLKKINSSFKSDLSREERKQKILNSLESKNNKMTTKEIDWLASSMKTL